MNATSTCTKTGLKQGPQVILNTIELRDRYFLPPQSFCRLTRVLKELCTDEMRLFALTTSRGGVKSVLAIWQAQVW